MLVATMAVDSTRAMADVAVNPRKILADVVLESPEGSGLCFCKSREGPDGPLDGSYLACRIGHVVPIWQP
jgi:hypothetical protein